MKSFGEEYSSNDAYFIAGGRTLELIKKYEEDIENHEALLAEVARDYGAEEMIGGHYMVMKHKTDNPALRLDPEDVDKEGGRFFYQINHATPEGRALQERLDDIPYFALGFQIFAKRLTGTERTPTNPDRLVNPSPYGGYDHYGTENSTDSATYCKYGDTYVVSVPRTIRGIFNKASEKASKEEYGGRLKVAAGHRYEWFTPPDSEAIPLSKVIELREREKGDQTIPKKVKQRDVVSAPRR